MGTRFRCRVSPTGVPGCSGDGTGGTGSGGEGPTGPTGPSGDAPDLEGNASTESNETLTVIEIPIGEDEMLYAGVRWQGSSAAGDVAVHEATFVFRRVGAGAPFEVGVHDNGQIRDDVLAGVAGADSDYVPSLTDVELTVTGSIGVPMEWIVETWFVTHPI